MKISVTAPVVVAFLACPLSASANPQPDKAAPKAAAPCQMPYDQAVAIGRRVIAAVQAGEFDDYVGKDAAALVDEINSEPPTTTLQADHVLVVELPGAQPVIALFNHGCEVTAFRAAPDKWRSVKSRILGQPS